MHTNVRTAPALIEAKLSEIEDHSDVGLLVEESWEKNQGQQCTGVAWDSFDVGMLSAIACGIGGKALASKDIKTPQSYCVYANDRRFGGHEIPSAACLSSVIYIY